MLTSEANKVNLNSYVIPFFNAHAYVWPILMYVRLAV